MVMLVAPVAAISAGCDHNSSLSSDAANLSSTDFIGYIPISSPSDLAKIGNNVAYPLDGKYYLKNDINFGKTDTNGRKDGNFDPIGNYDTPFTGTFDGNGYVISGVNIKLTTAFIAYSDPHTEIEAIAGLFAFVSGANILNLGLVNGSISLTGDIDFAKAAGAGNLPNTGFVVIAGSIIGTSGGNNNQTSSQITNCYNTCSVTASVSPGIGIEAVFAGGVAGTGNVQITDCYNTGSVTAISTSDLISSIAVAGGIVGQANNNFLATNCYNTGSVTATANSASSYGSFSVADSAAGGIVGSSGSYGQISNSYNTGSVIAMSSSNYVSNDPSNYNESGAGGIAGVVDLSFISNCYNIGSVSVSVTSPSKITYYAGGIYGWLISGSFITNCYFLTDIIEHTVNGSQVEDNDIGNNPNSAVVIDGSESGLPRAGSQGSGAYTAQQLKPALANAKNNNSTYYTGTTALYSLTFDGWDFDSIWTIDPGTNNGFPILSALSDSYSGSSGDSGGSDSRSSDSSSSGSGSNMALYAGVVVVIVIIGGCAVFFLHRGGKI